MSNESNNETPEEKKELIISQFLGQLEGHFVTLNKGAQNQLTFAKECEFALQILSKSEYLLSTAKSNPFSLKSAISNVAAIGISLNPVLSFAYLVPRRVSGQLSVCLDVSYRGLLKLATDTGVIRAMKAEIVYENDDFKYHGFHKEPDFEADPFGDRGDIRGVYALAIMADGQPLVEAIPINEVYAIRDDSEAYKAALAKGEGSWDYKNTVWVKFKGEMIKKVAIKRAYKTLPTSGAMESLGKAIEVINEHEGIKFLEDKREADYTDEELAEYKYCIDEADFYNLSSLIRTLSAESQFDLKALCVPEAEKGLKVKTKEAWRKNLIDAQQEVESHLVLIQEAIDEADDHRVLEILVGCSQWTLDYFLLNMNAEHQIVLNKIIGDMERE